jgi:hypothetical protein
MKYEQSKREVYYNSKEIENKEKNNLTLLNDYDIIPNNEQRTNTIKHH